MRKENKGYVEVGRPTIAKAINYAPSIAEGF
jgi:hypothetical protein